MKPQPRHSGLAHQGAGLVQLLVGLCIVGGVIYAGYAAWPRQQEDLTKRAIFHPVKRDQFELAIIERGEIESVGDYEVRSEVKTTTGAGLAILRIAEEGTKVKEGDFLVELDSAALEADRTSQQIMVNTAEAIVVESQNVYETSVIAYEEYLEGTFVQEKQTLESEIFVAEENQSRALEYLKYSRKLADKGYVNELQLQADEFAVDKSRKELAAAKTKLDVLQRFTRLKMLKQLQSDKLISKAKWEADKNSYKLEVDKLTDIEQQIRNCLITAPRDGMVKYAHNRDRGGQNDFIVEEGATVRERQTIIRLPDTSQMRVALTINESLVQHVRPGMQAVIEPVGVNDQALAGMVDYVNQYAEPSGWRKANVKEYKAYVKIADPSEQIRTGMTASVTIQSLYVPDALQVPVQAIYAHGNDRFCFIRTTDGIEAKPVVCGPTNDRFYVVNSGINESDEVALNPRRLVDQVSLPDLPAEQQQQVVRVSPMERQAQAEKSITVAESTEAPKTEKKPAAQTEQRNSAVEGAVVAKPETATATKTAQPGG